MVAEQPKPPRAVLRFAKVKTLQSLDRRCRHSARTQPVENADPERGKITWLTPGHNPAAAVRDIHAGLSAPPRKNAVLAVEAIVSASPAWFGEGPNRHQRAAEFAQATMVWAVAEFGGERIAGAVMHEDEATPHIHLVLVPVIEKTAQARGRKPKDGQPRPARAKRTLDFATLWGRPGEYRRLQDTIGEALAPLGIERGVRKADRPKTSDAKGGGASGSGAKHQEFRHWKAEQNAALVEAQRSEAAAQIHRTTAATAALVAAQEAKAARANRSAAETDRQAAAAALEEATRQQTFARLAAEAANADRKASAANKAEAAAWRAGLDAFASGELVAVAGPPGSREPVWSEAVPPARRVAIERGMASARPAVLDWLARLTSAVRRLVEAAEAEAAVRLFEAAREAEAVITAARRLGPEVAAVVRRQFDQARNADGAASRRRTAPVIFPRDRER